MKVAFVRGAYLNNFELQSYYPMLPNGSVRTSNRKSKRIKENGEFEIVGFGSMRPLHDVNIPVQKFWSPMDLPNFPKKMSILNRLCGGDAMYLYGMEHALRTFDIAHVRETYFHFSAQAIKAKLDGKVKKVLVTCSETIPNNHETIWGRKKLKNQVIEHADHFHCLTVKAKVALIAEGVQENRITVIPCGIDIGKFKVKNTKSKSSRLKVLFVGRLEQQKGVRELMAVWSNIHKKYKHVDLQIVGKGPLKSLVEHHNIDPISVEYTKMPDLFANADILVLPSRPDEYWEEYFGMVLLEAMASGLPILTTTCGAIPEVVGEAALVVEHSSAKALYKGLIRIIKHPRLRKELTFKGLQRVKIEFDADKQAIKLKKLYFEIYAKE